MTLVPWPSPAVPVSRDHKSPRPSTGRGLAAAAVALAIALSAAGSSAASATPAAGAIPPEYVVLIDGLCSSLPAGVTISPQFTTPGGLVERLAAAGRSQASIVTYSYQGGSVGADGSWQPDPYDCAASRDQGLVEDVDLLNTQLDAILEVHPGAAFHLVGFSQGGLLAFAELARLASVDDWTLPNDGRIATVVTLDSPLGGLPFVDKLCGLAPDVCGGRPVPDPNSSLFDMGAIWMTGTGHPAGADRSVASLFSGPAIQAPSPLRNQAVAVAAAGEHGIQVLTIGNVRDWVYAPLGAGGGPYSFLDGQWLTNGSGGLGVYARAIDSGPAACPASSGDLAASYGCNHNLVLTDAAAGDAVVATISGATPALAASCPPGNGGCVMLPPRPAIGISSAIAKGVVGTGGTFGTAGVVVPSGGRATLRFTTVPAVPGAHLEIWSRSRSGAYHRVTSRVADSTGVARYTTPPVTAWTAYQARYAGDFVHGPGVSAGRVVTIK